MQTEFGWGPSARSPRIGALLGTALLITCSLAVSAGAQAQVAETPHPTILKSFVGTWKGEFKGQRFAILKLRLSDEGMTGTLSTAQTISVDRDGVLQEVKGEATESKATSILDATLVGNALVFKNRAADDDEIATYKMQLSGDNAAGLKPEGVPESMKMKPFPLSREIAKP